MSAPYAIEQAVALIIPAIGDPAELRRALRAQADSLLADTPASEHRVVLERLEHGLLFRYSRRRILEGVRAGILDDETVLAIEDEIQAAAKRWRVAP